MIGFCSSPRFVDHDTGPHHPERPDRIRAIHRAVRAAGMVDSPDPFPDFRLELGLTPADGRGIKLREIAPEPAEERWIHLVHDAAYVRRIEHVSRVGGGVLDQGDTPIGPASYDVALLSCGAVLRACRAVMEGEVKRAFAASRPPGHHAEPDRPMGFCLFSNVAIAARFVQRQYDIDRVAVVDFDVHHGNGTQAVFEDDPSVLFVSMHQHPATLYPGSGYDHEQGVGHAKGTIINVPFNPGSGDAEYLHALDARVLPALEWFDPQVLLISAGFDAHRDDPLANIELSDDCYEQMTRTLVQFADRHCQGRVVSALEGGYHLRALGRSVVRHIIGLAS